MAANKVISILLGISLTLLVGVSSAEPAAGKHFAGGPGGFERLADARHATKGGFLPNLGNWFDSSSPGWGFDIQQVGDLLFVIWFTYLPNGSPVWYLAVSELDGMSWTADLEFYKWDRTETPGNQASASIVGTITIVWSDADNATANWTLNGELNSANISFAQFAAGPTLANMTGHYFPFWAPGWGFTMLTQGDVTVITMYFYKNGQPLWLQGVALDPGFVAFADMNVFNAPDLCPSCLSKNGAGKADFDFQLSARFRVDYTMGAAQDATITVEESVPGSTGFGPTFGDIPLGVVPSGGSSVTGAYMNHYLAGLDQPDISPPVCIAFEYRSNLMSSDPMPTGATDTHYVTSQRSPNGNYQVFNDSLCMNPHTWQSSFDGQFYNSWIQEAPTNMVDVDVWATQQKWFINIPDAFSFGPETCDLQEGIGTYGIKNVHRNEHSMVTGFTLNGTGVLNFELQRCTDGFSFVTGLIYQDPLLSGEMFLDEQDDQWMIRADVTYTFPF